MKSGPLNGARGFAGEDRERMNARANFTERAFPIHSTCVREFPDLPSFVPWWFVAPHEKQALDNHDQSLETLARRGGLGWTELRAVIEDKPYPWSRKNDERTDAEVVMALLAMADSP